LISDKTPWTSIENIGIGYISNLDYNAFIEKIIKFNNLSYESINIMRLRARKFARDIHREEVLNQNYKDIFNNLIQKT